QGELAQWLARLVEQRLEALEGEEAGRDFRPGIDGPVGLLVGHVGVVAAQVAAGGAGPRPPPPPPPPRPPPPPPPPPPGPPRSAPARAASSEYCRLPPSSICKKAVSEMMRMLATPEAFSSSALTCLSPFLPWPNRGLPSSPTTR